MNLVKWSEVSDIILLVINLPNFESKNISIDEKSLHYHGISNGEEYQDTIHFLYEINTKKCSGKITENSLEFVIYKKIPCYWHSLTRTNSQLTTDWNNVDNKQSENIPECDTIENNTLEVNDTEDHNSNQTDNIVEENLNDVIHSEGSDNETHNIVEENLNDNETENDNDNDNDNETKNDNDNETENDNNDTVIELDISNEFSDLEELSDIESDIDLNSDDNLEEVSFD
jgi:hypothetical protein